MKPIVRAILMLFALLSITIVGYVYADTPTSKIKKSVSEIIKSLEVQTEIGNQAQNSQKQIDNIVEQTQSILQQYRETVYETQTLRIYNQQLSKIIESQNKELKSLDQQRSHLEDIKPEIIPLMIRMLNALDQFVKSDIPFLYKERTNRVESLRDMMDQANVTVAEKYRRIIEAFEIENEYGRTIESYNGELLHSGKTRTVEFIRIGRIGFYYQTLNGEESGYWNETENRWQALESSHAKYLAIATAIAKKQAPPDLIRVLLPAVKAVQQ